MIFSMKIAYKLGVQSGAIILYIYIVDLFLVNSFFCFFFPGTQHMMHHSSLITIKLEHLSSV